MTSPKLSQPSSGLGGRGYRALWHPDQIVVPSVTTALSALDKPGIVNWHIENTVAHCVTNADRLAEMNPESAFRFMQYYTRRLNEKKVDEVSSYDYSMGVLSDLAELGDFIHKWIEDDLNGLFPEDPWREDQEQMIDAYLAWKADNDVEMLYTEKTVFGSTSSGDYAGTFDHILRVNGRVVFGDTKTARALYETHLAQLAALSAAHTMAVEVPEGTEGAVYHKMPPTVAESHGGQVDSWWVAEGVPGFQDFGILRVRPDDWDRQGTFIPAFCRMEVVPTEQVEAAFGIFEAGLAARHAKKRYDAVVKGLARG